MALPGSGADPPTSGPRARADAEPERAAQLRARRV